MSAMRSDPSGLWTRGRTIESSDARTATNAVIPAQAGTRLGPRFRGDDDRGNVTVNRRTCFTSDPLFALLRY